MQIGDRIKYLRKNVLDLTQQEFSKCINLSRSNLGNIETGRIDVTDRVLSDICQKFNVSEDWLRTGEGEVLRPMDREKEIADLAATLFKDEESSFRSRLIRALAKLDEDEWKVLEKIALEITEKKD